jgi:hypothetical protein
MKVPRLAMVDGTHCESLSLATLIARITFSSLAFFRASISSSPCPLKVSTATHNGHTLVHDRLADPEVAVDPLPDAGGFSN